MEENELLDKFGNLKQDEDTQGLLDLIQAIDGAYQKKFDELRAKDGLPSEKLGSGLGVLDCTLADRELFAPSPPGPECDICFLTMSSFHTYQPCSSVVVGGRHGDDHALSFKIRGL